MIYNFSAGPAMLPNTVKEQLAKAVIDYNGTGVSIGELGHRTPEFIEIISSAKALVRELLDINEDYEILFLTGGGNGQFLLVPYNLLHSEHTAAYVNTGRWSERAIAEAQHFGNVDIVASSEDKEFTYIPKNLNLQGTYDYLHITSNNTIRGTQYKTYPETDIPLVADMTSDICSRPFDINKFSLVFAATQKNLGISGTTLVIVKKEALGKVDRHIPNVLNYEAHIKAESIYNTAPVLPIYASYLCLQWLKEQGGVTAMQKINAQKATLLYQEVDRNSAFECKVAVEDRSEMNVVFAMKDDSLTEHFLSFAKERGCLNLKGHRSVGGFRASIYNAIPMVGVEKLVSVLQEYEASL